MGDSQAASGTDAAFEPSSTSDAARLDTVIAMQEYLNRQYFNGKHKLRMDRLTARMQGLWVQHNGSVVGFKWMWGQGLISQLDQVKAYLESTRPAIRLIFLIRTDCIEQYVSLQQLYLAQAPVHVVDGEGTFVYDDKANPDKNILAKSGFKEKKIYRFNTTQAKEHCRARAATWERVLETLPQGLVVLYTNHTYHLPGEPEAKTWDRVADYLGLTRKASVTGHHSIVGPILNHRIHSLAPLFFKNGAKSRFETAFPQHCAGGKACLESSMKRIHPQYVCVVGTHQAVVAVPDAPRRGQGRRLAPI